MFHAWFHLAAMPLQARVQRICLFGSTGLIGTEVLKELTLASGAFETSILRWSDFSGSNRESTLNRLRSMPPTTFVFANGMTDPRLPREEVFRSNLEFPISIVEATEGNLRGSTHRYLTFGSIQEHFPVLCESNPYLRSKLELGRWMVSHDSRRFLHLRLHTLRESGSKPYMFLGQIRQALKERKKFEMSDGDQLREYHSVEEVAAGVIRVLERDWDFAGILELNSGRPVTLAALAKAVFLHFEAEQLLEVGTLDRPSGENTEMVFERSPEWLLPRPSDPIAGVIQALERALKL